VSLGTRQRDGYVTRVSDGVDLGNEDMWTGQLGLRFKPSDQLSITLRGDYTAENENGSPFVFQAMNEAATSATRSRQRCVPMRFIAASEPV